MAIEQGGNGARDSGAIPALTDEQAERYAAAFTPSWVAVDEAAETRPMLEGTATRIGFPAAPAAVAAASTPVMTRIAEPAAPPAARPHAVPEVGPKETLLLPRSPAGPSQVQAQLQPRSVSSRPPSASAVAETRPSQSPTRALSARPRSAAEAAEVAAELLKSRGAARTSSTRTEPLRAPVAPSFADEAPTKRRSKTPFVVAGSLAVAALVGIVAKFAIGGDEVAAAPASSSSAIGRVVEPGPSRDNVPSATTAEDVPPPAPTTTGASHAAEPVAPPSSARVAAPPHNAPVAPHDAPAAPRTAAAPAPKVEPKPQVLAPRPRPPALPAPPPPTPTPQKTPPKPPSGGIVRDNPF